jgi:hypothetical protein
VIRGRVRGECLGQRTCRSSRSSRGSASS